MLTQLLISIPAFLLVITILVAVHEFGHYWVAKKVGIKVERFSIGFGKPLLRKFFKNNETEFVIATLPFGGYVKMLDGRVDDLSDSDSSRAYNNKSPWQRIAVLFAGPAANFIFAILVFWLLFLIGVTAFRPLVTPINHSVSQHAGLLAGDEVTAVNGVDVSTFEEFVTQLYTEILKASDASDDVSIGVNLTVLRDAERHELRLPISQEQARLEKPELLLSQLGIRNWQPPLKPIIHQVSANSPASELGLREGDLIEQFDDVKINSWGDLVGLIQQYPSQSKDISYLRDGQSFSGTINIGERVSNGQTLGIIGVSVVIPESYGKDLQTREKFGFFSALKKATQKTWDMCVLSLSMFKEMLKGNVSLKNLSGPVSIAEQAGYSVQSGLDRYVAFFALISIALGIVNLLPIPMLDGGQIVLNVLELGKGSPVSERTEMVYQQVGFLCILLMMGLAIFNDIERLIS